jgi:hypothetical protein
MAVGHKRVCTRSRVEIVEIQEEVDEAAAMAYTVAGYEEK